MLIDFVELYEDCRLPLRSHIYFRFQYYLSLAEAEEVVQEAFVRAIEKKDTFDGGCKPRTWLYRIATNYAIDTFYRRKVLESRHDYHLSHPELIDWQPAAESRHVLEKSFNRLIPRHQEIIWMIHYCQYTTWEAGEIMGIKHTGTKALLHRARKKLRQYIHEETAN